MVLAERLGVGLRTVERDLARLRESGVPIETVSGPHGASRLPRRPGPEPLTLTNACGGGPHRQPGRPGADRHRQLRLGDARPRAIHRALNLLRAFHHSSACLGPGPLLA
jgi:HTH domain